MKGPGLVRDWQFTDTRFRDTYGQVSGFMQWSYMANTILVIITTVVFVTQFIFEGWSNDIAFYIESYDALDYMWVLPSFSVNLASTSLIAYTSIKYIRWD